MLTIGDALAYQQMMEPVIRGLLSIFAKFILVIVSEIYFMFKRKFINYKVNGTAGFCSLIGIVIICVIERSFLYPSNGVFCFAFFGIGLMLLLISIFICNLFERMQIINNDKIYYQMEIQKQEMLSRHYTDSKGLYRSLREQRHDMKHHIEYMNYLLENQEYQKLEAYFDEICQSEL